jgi:aminobutyraldehyde dehydrogenase
MPIMPEMPHRGFRQSGMGNDMSIYALEGYTKIKHVMVNWSTDG